MAEAKNVNEVVPSVRQEGDATIAVLRGEIDLNNSPLVRTALLKYLEEHKPKKLVLNLGEVPYMDSSAIAVLVEALQKMRKIEGKIYLTNLQPRVKGLIEIAKLGSIFTLVDNEADALKK